MNFDLKTTSFILPLESYGAVYGYQVSNDFVRRWQELNEIFRKNKSYLPFGSLATALRWHLGCFIRLDPYQDMFKSGQQLFLVASKQVPKDALATCLDFWEDEIDRQCDTPVLGSLVREGALTECALDIGANIQTRKKACPTALGWVWEASKWRVAERLVQQDLKVDTDTPLKFVLDSQASLVCWDRPLGNQTGKVQGYGMHVITPRLITVPGFELPAIHLNSSISRLATQWKDSKKYSLKHAWFQVSQDKPLLNISIGSTKKEEKWLKVWSDLSVLLLNRIGYTDISEPEGYDLANLQPVRARYEKTPVNFPIGKGVGLPFHHYVAAHAHSILNEAKPINLQKEAPKQLPVQELPAQKPDATHWQSIIQDAGGNQLQIICLYSSHIVRKRLQDELQQLLMGVTEAPIEVEDGNWFRAGPLKILFVSPEDNQQFLLSTNPEDAIFSWIQQAIEGIELSENELSGFIVETCENDRLENSPKNYADPKPLIRRLLAKHGHVSQFVRASTLRQQDGKGVCHGAKRAIHDLLRMTGCYLLPFEKSPDPSKDCWYIGHFIRKSSKDKNQFHIAITACKAGSHQSLMLSPAGNWEIMPRGISSYISAQDRPKQKADACQFINHGLNVFINRFPNARFILLMDGRASGSLWSRLYDTQSEEKGILPDISSDERVSTIRIRNDSGILPRPAGTIDFNRPLDEKGELNPGGSKGIFSHIDSDYHGAYYCTQPSAILDNDRARKKTRFADQPRNLQNDRQAQTVTEIVVLNKGPFAEKELVTTVSKLCFQNLTWVDKQKTSLPSPLHLAQAYVTNALGDIV
ncbi:pPIWI_RE module domain-containing protein [Methylotuvimicrobium sp. KM1]|uniref:pPIWI_RE module domain-containing protein n=1 Tax=Methylotuvimicrobium sp. KM1 TaxID=3377707 RepID=UPI00384F6BC4